MMYSSSLDRDLRPLVLDTSVLINLHCSTYGDRILASLPNLVYVPEIVAQELDYGRGRRRGGEYQFLQDMSATRRVRLVAMNDREFELYQTLISGSQSLDDGEGATIAISASRGLIPVVDERKGRSRCQEVMPEIAPAWSLDLLRHEGVVKALGMPESIECLFLALRDGRMRIDPNHCEEVATLIGAERALNCFCLPNYKYRRPRWAEINPSQRR